MHRSPTPPEAEGTPGSSSGAAPWTIGLRATDRVPLALLTGAFLLSRWLLFRVGVRLNPYPLVGFWQHIDPVLLRERLWQSLFYLHSQPPLFNLLLGVVQKLSPAHAPLVFTALYKGVGLGFTLVLYALMTRLGIGRWLATVLTLVFVLSPACIFFENLPTYDYPIAFLLCAGAVMLHRFADCGRARDGFAFFSSVAAIVLIRSLFQVEWFVLAVLVVALMCRADVRRTTWRTALLPLAIVLALYAKNFMVFGTYTTSSWFGMNWIRVVTFQLQGKEQAAFEARGVLTPLAALEGFRPVEAYREYLPPIPPAGIPLLDEETKASGSPNYDHLVYIQVGKACAAAALRMIVEDPWLYGKGLLSSASIFFWPPTDYRGGAKEGLRGRLTMLKWIYNRLLYGQWVGHAPDPTAEGKQGRSLGHLARRTGWLILLGFPLLVVYAIGRLRSARQAETSSASAITLAFMLATILYVTVVAIAFEVGENNRFRFTIDPFLVTLLGMWIQDRWAARRPGGA